jgi:hypothetical protein
VGISASHPHIFIAEERLQRPTLGSSHRLIAGKSLATIMPGAGFGAGSGKPLLPNHRLEIREAFDGSIIREVCRRFQRLPKNLCQWPRTSGSPSWTWTLASRFASRKRMVDPKRSSIQIDIVPREPERLDPAQPYRLARPDELRMKSSPFDSLTNYGSNWSINSPIVSLVPQMSPLDTAVSERNGGATRRGPASKLGCARARDWAGMMIAAKDRARGCGRTGVCLRRPYTWANGTDLRSPEWSPPW